MFWDAVRWVSRGKKLHKCCFCPLASLPGRRWQGFTQGRSQDREVQRVLPTIKHAAKVTHGQGDAEGCWGQGLAGGGGGGAFKPLSGTSPLGGSKGNEGGGGGHC